MTNEAQRIAIAEACGWHKRTMVEGGPFVWHDGNKFRSDYEIPDYLNNLNAMHEAEKMLTHEQLSHYAGHLSAVCYDAGQQHMVHATAAQRRSVPANAQPLEKRMKRSPLKRKTPLRKMSKAKEIEVRKYILAKAQWLIGKFCEFPSAIPCINHASEPHYMKGQKGKLLNDQRYWMAVCREHHRWIEDHKRDARKMGLILYT